VDYFRILSQLFNLLRIKHRRSNLPVEGNEETAGLDRPEKVFDIIMRDEIISAIIERPIPSESDNWHNQSQSRHQTRFKRRRTLSCHERNNPAQSNTGGNSKRDERR